METPKFLRSWWIVPLVILFGIVLVFAVFQSGESRPRLALQDFVQEARAGDVSGAELDGRTLVYTLDGTTYETELARGDSITTILQNEGLAVSDQPRITLDDSSGASAFINLIITLLPIIIILGIVFFFLRAAQNPQKLRWQMIGLVTNVDPVCGTSVDPGRSAGTSTFQGITYYFCSAEHKQQFDADPVKYLLQK